jgi:hypothetical protein
VCATALPAQNGLGRWIGASSSRRSAPASKNEGYSSFATPEDGVTIVMSADLAVRKPSMPPAKSIRLTFRVEHGKLELRSATPVNARAPRGEAEPRAGASGIGKWVEVRDAQGATLYRRRLVTGLERDLELATGSPGSAFERRPSKLANPRLYVLVPALKEGRQVLIVERRARQRSLEAKGVQRAGAQGDDLLVHAHVELTTD